MRHFHEFFRKDVAYDCIESHKKLGFHSHSKKNTFRGKPQRGQINLKADRAVARNISQFRRIPKDAAILNSTSDESENDFKYLLKSY